MNKKQVLAFLLIFCNLIAFSIVSDLKKDQDFEVIFFDVGQGDAALIKTPQKHNILIDGGPGNNLLPYLYQELSFWNRDIDLIILSHPHADHLSGLVEVLDRFNVKKVVWNKDKADSLIYRKWKRKLEDTQTYQGYRGVKIYAGDVTIDTLYPKLNYSKDNLNANSLVNKVKFDDRSLLFTGDILIEQEKKLIEWQNKCLTEKHSWCQIMDLSAGVLKASHHGSSSSNSREFIEEVNPSQVVISAGKDNRYGFPHKEVINLLNNLKIDIHKTFEDGNLRVTAN